MASSALASDFVRRRRFAGLHEHFRLAPIHYVTFAGCDEGFDCENHPLPEARATALGAVGYLKAGVKLPASEAVACEVVYGLVTTPVNEVADGRADRTDRLPVVDGGDSSVQGRAWRLR